MLYLGIDQHARQLTISLRDDSGDVMEARQVSTRPEKIHEFFAKLTREGVRDGEGFIAVVEVCGFNDWLVRMLADYRCQKIILIQPEERSRQKTDRRDASTLSELLWVNHERSHMERDWLPPIREKPKEITSLKLDQIDVQSHVGGLVKSFIRKAG